MSGSTSSPTGSRRAALVLLLLPTAVVAVDINVLFLAMPRLTTDLGASAVSQLWITDVYGLMVGVLAIVAGAVGDRIGRRRLLLVGCAGFLAASLLAAFAPSVAVLLLARVLQGVAGATLMPSTLALIGEIFPDQRDHTRAIGAWATCQFTAAALGPVVGGLLLTRLWWGSVFLLSVPACLTVLLFGRRLLPESRSTRAARVDLPSAGLLIAIMAALFTVIKAAIPEATTPTGVVAAAALLAVVGSLVFVRRQQRLAEPLLELDLLRTPPVAVSVVSLLAAGVALAGTGLWVTQYLQSVVGLAPLTAAIAFAPMGIGIGIGTFLSPMLAQRAKPEVLVPAGLGVSVAGGLLLLAASRSLELVPVLISIALIAGGCGPLFAFGTQRVVSSAPPSASGRAAALAETSNYLGSSLGLALIGTMATAVFTVALRASSPTIGGGHIDSMAEAHHVAAGMSRPGPATEAIADAATQALHAVGGGVAVLLTACLALNVLLIRAEARQPRSARSVPAAGASGE
jgi:MFS transporter, DHA2 family, multidrug resistance protein